MAQEALRVAFEDHYARLLRLAVLLAGRVDTAEDLVQDAFVRAAPKLESLDPTRVGPYLRSVVVNQWKNRVRRLALERRLARSLRASGVATDDVDPRGSVWVAILRLPVRQRATVVLKYYEDLSEREIASVLGCSVGTVKSQLSKATRKLRRELADES